jgi:hypothetical protein
MPGAAVALLGTARRRNAAAGVTGMLLYRDGNVAQTLEAPDEAVEATFRRIEQDPRHRGVILLLLRAGGRARLRRVVDGLPGRRP